MSWWCQSDQLHFKQSTTSMMLSTMVVKYERLMLFTAHLKSSTFLVLQTSNLHFQCPKSIHNSGIFPSKAPKQVLASSTFFYLCTQISVNIYLLGLDKESKTLNWCMCRNVIVRIEGSFTPKFIASTRSMLQIMTATPGQVSVFFLPMDYAFM